MTQLILKDEATAQRRRILILLVDPADGFTPVTGYTVSAGELKVIKGDGSNANGAGTLTEILFGIYQYAFTAGEVNQQGYLGVVVSAATAITKAPGLAQVVEFDSYNAVSLGLIALPSIAVGETGGLPIVGGSYSGNAEAVGSDASHIMLGAGADATNNFYTGQLIGIVKGTGKGQVRQITGYVGATKIAAIAPDWDTTPDDTSDWVAATQ